MWYKGMSSSKRKAYARFSICNLVPKEPEKIRMGDLIKQAKEIYGVSAVTVVEAVKHGVVHDYYRRIEESHKKVFYQRSQRKGVFAEILMVPTLLVPMLERIAEPSAWEKRGDEYIHSSREKTEDGQIEFVIRFKPANVES